VLARILEPTEANLLLLSEALRNGELVGIPTETVYGLAANALDSQAVAKIFQAKERPTFDPLIVHIAPGLFSENESLCKGLIHRGVIDRTRLTPQMQNVFERLAETFWPGALTLIVPRGRRVPDLVTSGLSDVALRMPSHPLARTLIERSGCELAAPSANRFGRLSPTRAKHVRAELGERIAYILDGGASEIGVESTVLKLQPDGSVLWLRAGGISREQIERVLDRPIEDLRAPTSSPQAPGQLPSHYAPNKRLVLLPQTLARMEESEARNVLAEHGNIFDRVGLLTLAPLLSERREELESAWGAKIVSTSLTSDSSKCADLEAAQNLFQRLRELDESDAQILLAEPWSDALGLGSAIQDRLKRASHSPEKEPESL
jgi:L-threonylcarbamoyladenylate synthase